MSPATRNPLRDAITPTVSLFDLTLPPCCPHHSAEKTSRVVKVAEGSSAFAQTKGSGAELPSFAGRTLG